MIPWTGICRLWERTLNVASQMIVIIAKPVFRSNRVEELRIGTKNLLNRRPDQRIVVFFDPVIKKLAWNLYGEGSVIVLNPGVARCARQRHTIRIGQSQQQSGMFDIGGGYWPG